MTRKITPILDHFRAHFDSPPTGKLRLMFFFCCCFSPLLCTPFNLYHCYISRNHFIFQLLADMSGQLALAPADRKRVKSFNDLGNIVLKRLIKILNNKEMNVDVVTVVFDKYEKEFSIKSPERDRRGTTDSGITILIHGNRLIPNYRCFLKLVSNKAGLASFISDYICSHSSELLPTGKSIILAGGFKNGELVKVLKEGSVSAMDELKCTHEEADTHLLLHAVSLSNQHSRIIIRCDDTDVLVLLIYYWNQGMFSPEVYMHCEHSGQDITKEHYIPVLEIDSKLGSDIRNILPAVQG